MSKSYILRYTSANSNQKDSIVDMDIGKSTNMVGFGENNIRASRSVKAGNHVVIIPEMEKLKNDKFAYIHYVTSNKPGPDVWKHSNVNWEARHALFLGKFSLDSQTIESIGKYGAYPSDSIAEEIVENFLATQ